MHPWTTQCHRGTKRAREMRLERVRQFRRCKKKAPVQQQVTAGCGKEWPLLPIGQQAAMISHAGEAVGALARPRLRLTLEGECGVYRAIVATGILSPRVERSCAGKKGGRTVHSASVSNGVGGLRRAYSASGCVSRADNPLVRWCRRR